MHVGFDFVVRNLHKGTYWLWFRVSELGFARLWKGVPLLKLFLPYEILEGNPGKIARSGLFRDHPPSPYTLIIL